MTAFADILIEQGAPGKGAPPPLRWLADWLPDAERVALSAGDLDRINAYRGAAAQLHELLPAVLPLVRPVWYEADVTAQHGTRITIGYGGVPAPGGIDIGWASYSPEHGRILGPLGPARVTATGMNRPSGLTDFSWRELQVAGGIVLRAILFRRETRR